jgi:hypothetical protein
VRDQQYVGIDLHRRRSVIVRINDAGEVLGVSKIDNGPLALSMAVAEAGPDPEVNRPGFRDCSGFRGTASSRGLGLTVVESFHLCWRDVTVVVGDLAVETAMVEPVDVLQGSELDIVDTPPWSEPVDQFPLEQPVEALGHGVVSRPWSRRRRRCHSHRVARSSEY